MNTTISNTTTNAGNMPAPTRDIAGIARDLGLKPTQAWVVDETGQVKSRGAERVRRHREKVEQQGLKQVSVTLPAELHPWIKEVAAGTKAGNPLEAVLAELMPALVQPDQKRFLTHSEAVPILLDTLPTWRRRLLRWFLWWFLPCDGKSRLN